MKTVKIYSTPTCGYCKMAKDYFTENGVAFTEYDVASDIAKREEMVNTTGQMGVPVIMVGDEGATPEVIIGFDRPKLAELLGL